jgi:crotonobetainyl-CoA:carnitine CoA-transferase CaiB-like acyl-CoA transferase
MKTSETGPLTGVVVVDLSDNAAGRYAGQLLADLGADVIRFDGRGGRDDALLRNRILLPAGDADARRTALDAAAVLLTGPRRDTGCPEFSPRPGLIRAAVSPFGVDGPWAGRAGDDLIVQALAGAMEVTGEPGRPPVRMGAPVLPLTAGAQAVVAILAALLEPTDAVRDIDVSLLDVSLSMLSYIAPLYLTLGTVPARVGSGHPTIYPYNAFEVADGYLVVAPFTGRFWRKFCDVLGVPEWGRDERFRSFQDRLDNRHILEPLLNDLMKQKTRAEWLRLLEAGDVPCGPVTDVAEALTMVQTQARGLVVEVAGAGRALGLPVKFTGADGTRYTPAYRSARPETAVRPPAGPPAATAERPPALPGGSGGPLAGIRVVDLTRMAAGPFCTEMLSDLGADVIKIEEPAIGDPTRRNVPAIDGLSSYFLAFNRGKRSVAVDMKTPAGRAVVLDLLAGADVVVENFRPDVMERLGLGYDTVRAVNERIVFASISGFGQTGPLRLKTSFDLVNQAMAGMLSITGEPDRAPVRLGLPVGDLAGGQFTALGIVAELVRCARTGAGGYVDVSLHDVLVTLLGDVAQRYLDAGEVTGRLGSRFPDKVPAGVFEAADGYIALEAWTNASWADLAAELGRPGWCATAAERLAHREEVTAWVAAALRGRSVESWVETFAKSAVGAAPVLDVGQALDSGHARARDLVVEVRLPSGGTARTIGSAFRINGAAVVSPAGPPDLGEHSALAAETLIVNEG